MNKNVWSNLLNDDTAGMLSTWLSAGATVFILTQLFWNSSAPLFSGVNLWGLLFTVFYILVEVSWIGIYTSRIPAALGLGGCVGSVFMMLLIYGLAS